MQIRKPYTRASIVEANSTGIKIMFVQIAKHTPGSNIPDCSFSQEASAGPSSLPLFNFSTNNL